MMSQTEKVAQYIVKTNYEDIPQDAINKAKEALTDVIGVALAGTVQDEGEIIIDYVKNNGGKPESSVFGSGYKTSALWAAFANGFLDDVLDFNDNAWGGHPNAVLLPTVLALGEKNNSSGKDVLEAQIIGCETWANLFKACNSTPVSYYIQNTIIFGCMGATAAAAKILDLTVEQTRIALGIAASRIGGVRENFGTMVKPFHVGNAAQTGVMAAELAQKGLIADKNILEAERGFYNAVVGPGRFDLQKLESNLGKDFYIGKELCFKRYPACYSQFKTIETIFYLMKTHNISYEDIAVVTIDHAMNNAAYLLFSKPDTALRGKFSATYGAAVAILDGKVDINSFTEDRYPDPKLDEAMEKVKVVIHTDWSSERPGPPSPVTILLKDGRSFTHYISSVSGTPELPFSREEIYGKYHNCTKDVLSEESMKKSLKIIDSIEDISDVTELMNILRNDKQ